MTLEEEDALAKSYDELSVGSELKDAEGVLWHKEGDGLWNGAFGIRLNSLALVSHMLPVVVGKTPKGVSPSAPTLFG